ncbi:type I secretion system permease/ATPase [Steroidobacter flavus]|uniref:Type I secretion system permease/ATPase n=1 Tax=Steroidobacter flavus TaxID=1842136 RepID=A0ABV8T0Z7_9GAMM
MQSARQSIVEAVVPIEDWEIPATAPRGCDPLLACLVHVTGLFGKPWSSEALTAGLPLPDHGLTPELFVRAATRAGLSAQIIRRTLEDISSLALPAVVLLNERRACVLIDTDNTGRLQLLQPESGGVRETTLAELNSCYSGAVIFVRPRIKLDARSEHSAAPRAKHWFWNTIAQCWPIYAEVLIASLLINLFALFMPFFTMNVYDRVVPNLAVETLWVLTIGVCIVFAFDLLMRTLRAYFIDVAGKRVDVVLSAQLFSKVLGLRMADRPASVGAFANNVQEFESLREFVTSATITTLVDLPFAVLFIVVMAWIGGPIAWVPLIAFPLIVGFGIALQGPLSRSIQESFRHAAQRQATLIETLAGLETIKGQRAEGPAQRRWEQAVSHLAMLGLRTRLLSNTVINFSAFVQQMAYVAVVVWGVHLIAAEQLTVGGLIACTLLVGRVLAPLSQIAGLLTRYHHARTALASINRIMHLPEERPAEHELVSRPRLQGAIEFRDVTFKYPGQDLTALANVSFRIAPGERVALIGRIGSGKTTIEKLVLGLHTPTAGSILIDGIESRQIDPVELRRDVGYVPQDIVLFYGSVRDNIVLGAPRIEDESMLRAAEQAGVTEFVNSHPRGFAMPVGERGEAVSGGQRQAIAIARAYLLQPPILLFDEPSNAMDNRTEEQFKARLAGQLDGRTLLLITHRASLLSLVNRIIVIEAGRVAADGPRDQVLAALAGGKIGAGSR